MQLESGTETLFFILNYEKYSSLVTNTWSKNLWEYMMLEL